MFSNDLMVCECLGFSCRCGRTNGHPINPKAAYMIIKNITDITLVPYGAPVTFITENPDHGQESWNYLLNQSRIFPEGMCPYFVFHCYSNHRNHLPIDVYCDLLKAMWRIANLSEKEYEMEKITKIKFEINHYRVAKTTFLYQGVCECGMKHVLKNKAYDLVFLYEGKLIGIDLRRNIFGLLKDVCEQMEIDYGYSMFVFEGIVNALKEMNDCREKNDCYCHGFDLMEPNDGRFTDFVPKCCDLFNFFPEKCELLIEFANRFYIFMNQFITLHDPYEMYEEMRKYAIENADFLRDEEMRERERIKQKEIRKRNKINDLNPPIHPDSSLKNKKKKENDKYQKELNEVTKDYQDDLNSVLDEMNLTEQKIDMKSLDKKYSVIVKKRQEKMKEMIEQQQSLQINSNQSNTSPNNNDSKKNEVETVEKVEKVQEVEDVNEINSNVNSIEEIQPQQYTSSTKTITIKIMWSKGTARKNIQFEGNNQTTIAQMIAHIKWVLQENKIENVNGILKDGKMKELKYKFNQTLSSLNLNRVLLNYVLPK